MSRGEGQSLRRMLILLLAGYATLIAISVAVLGAWIHEQAEHTVWRAVLGAALQRASGGAEGGEEQLKIWIGKPDELPPAVSQLSPGLHDHWRIGDRVYAAYVLEQGERRAIALLDVSAFESEEWQTALSVAVAAAILMAALTLAMFLAGRRIARPFERIAESVEHLDPESSPVLTSKDAPREAVAIAQAVERLVERIGEVLARERAFAETVSHELRTPLSAMQSTIERLLALPDLGDPLRRRIERLARSVGAMRETVEMLLILARRPERIAGLKEPLDLAEAVKEIIEEHTPLLAGRPLRIRLVCEAQPRIEAPAALFRAAAGNLLRNAIEHGGEGDIEVRLADPARLIIADPGPGFDLDAIAARWQERVRSRRPGGGGIGLTLTRRLVEHLGWRLHCRSRDGGGTVMELDLSSALIGPRL